MDPNGKRYRSVVEVERALGLRAPKGSTEAGSASRGRKRARDVSPHPMDHMNKPKTKMTTSVVPFKRYKKQMNIEEPITPDDIFGKSTQRRRAHRVYGKALVVFDFYSPFPPSNLFHCLLSRISFYILKQPQTSLFFLTYINIYLTSFYHTLLY